MSRRIPRFTATPGPRDRRELELVDAIEKLIDAHVELFGDSCDCTFEPYNAASNPCALCAGRAALETVFGPPPSARAPAGRNPWRPGSPPNAPGRYRVFMAPGSMTTWNRSRDSRFFWIDDGQFGRQAMGAPVAWRPL